MLQSTRYCGGGGRYAAGARGGMCVTAVMVDCTLTRRVGTKMWSQTQTGTVRVPLHTFGKWPNPSLILFELLTRFFLRVATAFQFKFCSLPAPRGRHHHQATISVARSLMSADDEQAAAAAAWLGEQFACCLCSRYCLHALVLFRTITAAAAR